MATKSLTSLIPHLGNFVDEHEAARIVGYTVAGLRSRRYAGQPPVFYKIGGRVRYTPEDLAEWVAASRQGACTNSN